MITEYGNYISDDPDYKYKYEDGIMNYELFKNEKIKILWILRETHGKFNPKKWWGDKDYLKKKIEPFDSKDKKGSKKDTWQPVAKICNKILNNKESNDDYELAATLERISIINLKKTSGGSKITKKFAEVLKKQENRDIFVTQIKRIKPDVIICGNTLNKIKTSEINFREGKPKTFSSNAMKKNHYFCFKNVVFINIYHPSNISIKEDEYVKAAFEAYQDWNKNKVIEDWTVFDWN